jgi:hypothetical protein
MSRWPLPIQSSPMVKQSADCGLQELGKYGTLYIEVTYHPFVSPEKQEEVQKKMEEARRKAMEVCLPAEQMV